MLSGVCAVRREGQCESVQDHEDIYNFGTKGNKDRLCLAGKEARSFVYADAVVCASSCRELDTQRTHFIAVLFIDTPRT